MQTESSKTQAIPVAAAVVSHEVTNYEAWRAVFDEHAGARKRAGILHAHVNRSAENPNLLMVYLAASSSAALQGFLTDPDLKSAMQRGGVSSPPTIVTITPVEDLTVKDRPLPGAIVRHRVENFETWKRAFDAHGPARAKAGVIGHAVNRSSEDPNLVVVYLQAESLDALREFVSSADVKSVMVQAGVQGPPQISLVQGGAWGQ